MILTENTYVHSKGASWTATLNEHSVSLGAVKLNEAAPRTALPRVRIPQFSGAYSEWPTFRDLFLSVVVITPPSLISNACIIFGRSSTHRKSIGRVPLNLTDGPPKLPDRRTIRRNNSDEWENSISDSTSYHSTKHLLDFMTRRMFTLNAVHPKTLKKNFGESSRTAKTHVAKHGTNLPQCALCHEKHHLMTCREFKMKSAADRKAFVETHRLCFNCLGNHYLTKCQSKKNCNTCKARHHTLLHDAYNTVTAHTPEATSLAALHKAKEQKAVLLATARVNIADRHGAPHDVRALIDQGSEVSIVSEALVQRLNLPRSRTDMAIFGIGGARPGSTRGTLHLTLDITNARLSVIAFILPRLSLLQGSTSSTLQDWPHIRGLQLADPQFHENDPAELLLGAEVCSLILEEGLRKGGPQMPIAQKTSLGWILSGGSDVASAEEHRRTFQCTADHELLELVQQFWEQERETNAVTTLSVEEQQCEEFFVHTHTRTPSGRYVVKLPFSSPITALRETRKPAERLLTTMERRYVQDRRFGNLYRNFMKEYEDLKHMTLVTCSTTSNQSTYLLHHGVLKESSATTKLRVVFNGSQRTRTGDSLNAHLMIGANLLPALPDVLLRWRQHQYVFVDDIEKMYRQILVHPDDCKFQTILWRHSTDDEVREYQLRTVTYGLACAPFLAIRTLRQLATDEEEQFPRGAVALRRDCYVDDVVTGSNTLNDAIALQTEIRNLCLAGGFPLKKWAANDERILTGVPSNHLLQQLPPAWEEESHATLGLRWHPQHDQFSFVFHPHAAINHEENGLDWDTPLPPSKAREWQRLLEELHLLDQLRIKRWLGTRADKTTLQLHGFADASEQGYAAAVYIRITERNETSIRLLMAKSKATSDTYLWSDSTVTLQWIRGHSSRWKTFVANRVAHIQTQLPNAQWRHVAGHDNPADCASRGINPSELINHALWWTGPTWLSQNESAWPNSEMEIRGDDVPERKATSLMTVNRVIIEPEILLRFSSLHRLLRISAWCRRWLRASEPTHTAGLTLSPEELDMTLFRWLREVQTLHFTDEITVVAAGRSVAPSSTLAKLTPFLDDHGVLRVGGRLKNALLTQDERHPMIIPTSSWLTRLLVESCHRRTLHGGVQLTLGLLRLRFWIPRGRTVVKQ
ncbi:uncharacterized protein LOC114946340 [Nylanderia fulva]|uniref:uncharacterized protein LOC114946340 n=1 Tax=Nylanderia fulva TaxID=613905 RepID=UPI0010FB11D4|nr:uncharacterized protein LOC114946340 [Nylanderia fulva]